ncbi:MAG: hypothetical protein ABL973_17950 [Micropepsaceae bacterium]
MRILLVTALLLPWSVQSLLAASSSGTPPKTIKIKEEIVNKCGNFPYAPTLAIEVKTATLADMKRARKAVDNYVSEVSYYEKCLLTLDKTIGPSMTERDSTYVAFVFNRAQDERDVLAIDFNKLVDAYNTAHGIVTKPEKPTKPAKTTAPAKPATPAKRAAAKPATAATPAVPANH